MGIQKAKDSRQSFKSATDRNLSEAREMKIMAKRLEEERAKRAKELRLAKAADTRLKNRLRKQLLLGAGQGSKFVALSSEELSVADELIDQGIQVATVAALKREVVAGLQNRSENSGKPIMSFPEKAVLPLREFLTFTMELDWGSRQNKQKELEAFADYILEGLVTDLKSLSVERAKKRYEHLCSLDSDDRHSELRLRDFLLDSAECSSVTSRCRQNVLDIYIEVELEPELFSLLSTLTGAIHRAIQVAKLDQEVAADVRSELRELSSALDAYDDEQHLACWWNAELWFPDSPPQDLASQLWWLSFDDGQAFIAKIGDVISGLSRRGRASETSISFSSSEANLHGAAIVVEYMKALGYKCVLSSKRGGDPLEYVVSW